MLNAAHAPGSIRLVIQMPTVVFGELLTAQTRHHRFHLRLPSRTFRPAERTQRKRRRVVRIIRQGWIDHSQRAFGIRIAANKFDGPVDFGGWLAIVNLQ